MNVGVSLKSLRLQQEMRILANQGKMKLPAEWGDVKRFNEESLNINVSGTDYPVFVLGVNDPDDATAVRYIP